METAEVVVLVVVVWVLGFLIGRWHARRDNSQVLTRDQLVRLLGRGR